MIIRIDFDSPVPLYEQLYNCIIEGIASGALAEGDPLQSVRKVASDLSINLHTVNKAYSRLKDDGFLALDRSRGMVVSPPAKYAADGHYAELLKDQLRPVIAQVLARGLPETEFNKTVSDVRKSILGGNAQ